MTAIAPDSLRRLYRDNRLIIFVGSGISTSVEWDYEGDLVRGVTWSQLVDEAARHIAIQDANLLRVRGNDLQILEYVRQHLGQNLGAITTWFTRRMHPPDEALLDNPILSALANLERLNLVYTTNFDDFIERRLALAGRNVSTIVTENDVARHLTQWTAASDTTQIVKFHGDINNPDAMVLTEAQYETRLRLESLVDRRLLSDLVGRAVLFIGYSFSDINVAYLFSIFTRLHGPMPPVDRSSRAYITVSDPSDFERTLFSRREIEVLPISTWERSDDVAAILASLDD